MKKYDVIIVGGCAAGLSAAISAKRNYPSLKVAVLEKLARIGKKLLATGNGKCNLTNDDSLRHNYVNKEFAHFALNAYPSEKTKEFFASMGLLCYSDSCARVYPESNTAASVVDALRFEVERLGIDVFCNTAVTDIKKVSNRFFVNGEFECAKLILTTGGKSSPSQGSDGSGYELAKKLGHSIEKTYPALVPLTSSSNITKPMKGVRVRNVELALVGNEKIAESAGEILFTDSGLSGIAAMELAASAQKYIDSVKRNPFTHIDFLPQMSRDSLVEYLKSLNKIKGFCKIENLLTGVLPKAVGIVICKAAKLYNAEMTINAFNEKELAAIAEKAKNFAVEITGTKGFANSQVTSGGVKTTEIDPETMQSEKCEGLYFAGEIIDVDGGCGGFNLQWAWASGMLAGEVKK